MQPKNDALIVDSSDAQIKTDQISTVWKKLAPYMFDQDAEDNARTLVNLVLGHIHKNSQSLLDVCCGVGLHARHFVNHSLSVVGLDLDQAFLCEAKKRIPGDAFTVVRANMASFDLRRSFDCVCNLGTSFGFLETEEHDKMALRTMASHCSSRGHFVLDLHTNDTLRRSAERRHAVFEGPSGFLAQQLQFHDNYRSVTYSWSITEQYLNQAPEIFVVKQNLYSREWYETTIASLGFSTIKCFGSASGEPFELGAERLILIANR